MKRDRVGVALDTALIVVVTVGVYQIEGVPPGLGLCATLLACILVRIGVLTRRLDDRD